MKIGFHTWEPGLTSGKPSSAGGGAWMTTLFDALRKEGHEIVWIPGHPCPPKTIGIGEIGMANLDVAFFGWRWPMPDYPERNELYHRQWEAIHQLREATHKADGQKVNIPVIIHDQDHMISMEDEARLHANGSIITSPEFFPREGVRTLMFPNPYKTRYTTAEDKVPFLSFYSLVYVGNNYGRWDQTVKFIEPMQRRWRVKMYGNWLEPHPSRTDPAVVRATLPHVEFGLRIQQDQVIDALAEADVTVHLFKPSYGPTGFTTIRWAEAVAAGTPAFVPSDFHLPDQWNVAMKEAIVEDGQELEQKYYFMTDDTYNEILNAQRAFVDSVMTVKPWLDLIQEVTHGK